MEIKLSILVAGCLKRMSTTGVKLIERLLKQTTGTPDVEVLWLLDDQKVSTGIKRQRLLDMARGKFITYVDDDDMVEEDYVASILAEIDPDRPADLITFMVRYYEDAHHRFDQDFSITYPHPHDSATPHRKGTPSHTMAWRRALVMDIPFANRYYSEDRLWVDVAMKRVIKERKIGRVLYHYRHISGNSDHLRLQEALDRGSKPAPVAPVIPLRADGRRQKVVPASLLRRDRRKWWEREHQQGYLRDGDAGSAPAEVVETLGLAALVSGEPKTIIEIGTGSGALLKHLSDMGHKCYGADVSETARTRIESFATPLTPEEDWPQADLVISYLCLQHMPDSEALTMLEQVFSCLKPGGRLACQYAFLMKSPIEWFIREVASGMTFVRAPEVMALLVDAAGGRVIDQRVSEAAPGVGWSALQAERKP